MDFNEGKNDVIELVKNLFKTLEYDSYNIIKNDILDDITDVNDSAETEIINVLNYIKRKKSIFDSFIEKINECETYDDMFELLGEDNGLYDSDNDEILDDIFPSSKERWVSR